MLNLDPESVSLRSGAVRAVRHTDVLRAVQDRMAEVRRLSDTFSGKFRMWGPILAEVGKLLVSSERLRRISEWVFVEQAWLCLRPRGASGGL